MEGRKKMNLKEACSEIMQGEEGKRLYALADQMSSDITVHNWKHGFRVSRRAVGIARKIERAYPGTFKPEHFDHIEMAGFAHDVGRSKGREFIKGESVERSA